MLSGCFRSRRALCAALVAVGMAACEDGGLPEGWRATPAGDGPRIVWDLNHEPLPELPLPNDLATWPDPTSPTGRRINVSQVAPTGFERLTRELFDQVDGWGTYGAISIPFDRHLDTRDVYARMGEGGSAAFSASRFQEHAVYLVNLETGEPVPLDVNGGHFQYVLDNPNQYWENDPRAGESNLLYETVDEDANGNGVLDPGEDTDFDGVLDAPNTFDGTASDPLDTVDEMTWFYERETKTLVLRPVIPMEPRTTYAVVVTDRLRGQDGEPVRSPFEMVHPLTQKDTLEDLPSLLAAHPEVYGDLADRGWEGVAFAWSFTTQSVHDDLDGLRAGLYGDGAFAWLAEEFPPDYAPMELYGGNRGRCPVEGVNTRVADGEDFLAALESVGGAALGLSEEQTEKVLGSYRNLSHVAVLTFDTPYLLGDPRPGPDQQALEESWQVDWQTGQARVSRETISMILFVPEETAAAAQPFPVAFYVHGYGSASAEPIPFAGYMLQHGVATAMVNAEGHGVPLPPELTSAVDLIFSTNCIGPAGSAILGGRAEDRDGDGAVDSGVDFWTAYVFHTRDVVRQSVLDHMRAIQILRSFDGERRAGAASFAGIGEPPFVPEVSVDAEGNEVVSTPPIVYDGDAFAYEGADLAGDLDGDGVPDVGGVDQNYFFTGGSLGGIVSGVLGGAEPAVRAVAPIVGAGGLTDVAMRIDMGTVRAAMHLRMMGPFVMAAPADARSERDSSCPDGEVSLYFYASSLNSTRSVEFACVDAGLLDEDAVIVVRSEAHDELSCAGATGGEAGRFRVGFPADPGDRVHVEIYPDARDAMDFGECHFREPVGAPADVIDTFRVGSEACERCARYQQLEWAVGDRLVSPAMGFGNARQTPDLRRLLMLAQSGLEPADPVNYARRVFLEPVGAADAPQRPTNLLVVNSVGDQSVPVSTGNAYARAAGVLPFVPPDGPESLREWRAPSGFASRYPGLATPHDLLNEYHVLEGVDRLNRHPAEGREDFYLFDVDDVSEGRLRFRDDGRHQSTEPDAPQAPRLDDPLRWTRRSASVASGGEGVWSVLPGDDVSGLLNNYAIPRGVHGFDEIVYLDVPWDTSQYLINLVARWGATSGQDLRYVTDPDGHQCLEDSSCDFLPPPVTPASED